MNRFALLAAGLLALTAPLAWTVAPVHAGGAPAPAPAATAPAGTPSPADASASAPGDAGTGTLRVRLVNEGDAATLLLSVTDASGVARHELRAVPARATTTVDYQVPLGKATSEVRNGLAGGMSTSDLSRCASRLVEQNFTVSASLTSWSMSVDGWCVTRSA